MKRGVLIMTLFVVLLIVAACGGGSDESKEKATSVPVATQGGAAPAAKATLVAEPATVEEEPALSEDQLKDIENLDSYRAITTWSSKGKDSEGKNLETSTEITMEYTKEPPAQHMAMSTSSTNADQTNDVQSFDMYQIGTDMYMSSGEDGTWMRVQQDELPIDPSFAGLSGGQFFTNLEDLKRVRPDQNINGIDSRHYTYDERVLGMLFGSATGDVTAEGDVWIAKDGGYVTKYVVTIEVKNGSGDILAPTMTEGTSTLAWELQEVNSKDLKIELPKEAVAGATLAGFDEAFPTPEGSSVQASSGDFAMIQTDLTVEEVTKFYEDTLSKLGWTKDDSSSGEFGGMTSLSFAKDGVQLSVMITADEDSGKTQIMASAQKP